MRAEISYDLIMEDRMGFSRGEPIDLSGKEWQVFIFSPGAVTEMQITHGRWKSGVTGLLMYGSPKGSNLNKQIVEQVLGHALGIEEWIEVRGPDSMQLR